MEVFPNACFSLRRHYPDQVRRVSSQFRKGTPLKPVCNIVNISLLMNYYSVNAFRFRASASNLRVTDPLFGGR